VPLPVSVSSWRDGMRLGGDLVDLNALMVFFLNWEVDWLAKFLNYVALDRRFIRCS